MKGRISTFIILLILSFIPSRNFSQSFIVKNVSTEIQEDRVIIYYDLIGDISEKCEIKLFLKRESDKEFLYEPKSLKGDFGEGIFVGVRRSITWSMLKDITGGLEGDDYIFEVQVYTVGGGIPWYYYVGGGAVGLVVALLAKGSSSDGDTGGGIVISIPQPPRPANK